MKQAHSKKRTATHRDVPRTQSFQQLIESTRLLCRKVAEPRSVREADEHRSRKMQEKITVDDGKALYAGMPIKPGFLFFECLIKAPRTHVNSLAVHIPDSLYCTDKVYFIRTTTAGYLQVTTDLHSYQFMKVVEAHRQESSEPRVTDKVGAVVRMMDERLQDMKKVVFDWNQFKVKMVSKDPMNWSLTQRFVKCPGNRPSVTRLHFFASTKNHKSNFAYFIVRAKPAQTLTQCVVDTALPESFEVVTLAGKALRPFEVEAEKLVAYLNKGYNLRITELVLDFIRDECDIVWLIGCKRIRVDPTSLSGALEPVDSWWPETHLTRHRSSARTLGPLTSLNMCKVCRTSYPSTELSHFVSVRMLVLFQAHAGNRTELPKEIGIQQVANNDMLSQTIRVCDYCYMLVTGEFELMKLEEALAELLNVPIARVDSSTSLQTVAQMQFLPKQLHQWRVLLMPVRAFDCVSLSTTKRLHLHIRFDSMITSFPVDWEEVAGEECVELNMPRLHYLFSDSQTTIKPFVKTFPVEFRLTIGEVFNREVLGTSKYNAFDLFPGILPVGDALYETRAVRLCDQDGSAICTMQLVVGLSLDKTVKREAVLTSLTKWKGIYIASNEYMTVDPLPYQWMEAFTDYKLQLDSFRKQCSADINFYTPQMSKAEFRRIGSIQRLQASVSTIAKIPQELKKVDSRLKSKRKPKHRKNTHQFSSNSELKDALNKHLPLIHQHSLVDLSSVNTFQYA